MSIIHVRVNFELKKNIFKLVSYHCIFLFVGINGKPKAVSPRMAACPMITVRADHNFFPSPSLVNLFAVKMLIHLSFLQNTFFAGHFLKKTQILKISYG